MEAPTNKRRVAYVFHPTASLCQYSPIHSMKPVRVRMAHDLIAAYGLLPKMQNRIAPHATEKDMARFHSLYYSRLLRKELPSPAVSATPSFLSEDESDDDETPIGLTGRRGDNPKFPHAWRFLTAAAGASLAAAQELCTSNADIAINWLGGLHHGRKRSVYGFCYVNDIVLAILELLQTYPRVLYVDIDAHHGDAVERAFLHLDRVLTLSLHHRDDDFFPYTGDLEDVGHGAGMGYSVNVPFKSGLRDENFEAVWKPVLSAVLERFQPSAIVVQSGADSLSQDPIAPLNLTLQGHAAVQEFLATKNIPMLVLGGGGYNTQNVARCWSYETASLVDGRPPQITEVLPETRWAHVFKNGATFDVKLVPQRKERNTAEDIDRMRSKILQNLKDMTHAPSVPLHETRLPESRVASGLARVTEPDEYGTPDNRDTSDRTFEYCLHEYARPGTVDFTAENDNAHAPEGPVSDPKTEFVLARRLLMLPPRWHEVRVPEHEPELMQSGERNADKVVREPDMIPKPEKGAPRRKAIRTPTRLQKHLPSRDHYADKTIKDQQNNEKPENGSPRRKATRAASTPQKPGSSLERDADNFASGEKTTAMKERRTTRRKAADEANINIQGMGPEKYDTEEMFRDEQKAAKPKKHAPMHKVINAAASPRKRQWPGGRARDAFVRDKQKTAIPENDAPRRMVSRPKLTPQNRLRSGWYEKDLILRDRKDNLIPMRGSPRHKTTRAASTPPKPRPSEDQDADKVAMDRQDNTLQGRGTPRRKASDEAIMNMKGMALIKQGMDETVRVRQKKAEPKKVSPKRKATDAPFTSRKRGRPRKYPRPDGENSAKKEKAKKQVTVQERTFPSQAVVPSTKTHSQEMPSSAAAGIPAENAKVVSHPPAHITAMKAIPIGKVNGALNTEEGTLRSPAGDPSSLAPAQGIPRSAETESSAKNAKVVSDPPIHVLVPEVSPVGKENRASNTNTMESARLQVRDAHELHKKRLSDGGKNDAQVTNPGDDKMQERSSPQPTELPESAQEAKRDKEGFVKEWVRTGALPVHKNSDLQECTVSAMSQGSPESAQSDSMDSNKAMRTLWSPRVHPDLSSIDSGNIPTDYRTPTLSPEGMVEYAQWDVQREGSDDMTAGPTFRNLLHDLMKHGLVTPETDPQVIDDFRRSWQSRQPPPKIRKSTIPLWVVSEHTRDKHEKVLRDMPRLVTSAEIIPFGKGASTAGPAPKETTCAGDKAAVEEPVQ